jgi:hypothetical protein
LLKFSALQDDPAYTDRQPKDMEDVCLFVRSLLTFTTKGPEAEIKAPEAGWTSQPASSIQVSPAGQSPGWTDHRGLIPPDDGKIVKELPCVPGPIAGQRKLPAPAAIDCHCLNDDLAKVLISAL